MGVIRRLDQSRARIVTTQDEQFNEKASQVVGDYGCMRERRGTARVAQARSAWSIWFIGVVSFSQTDKTDRIDETDELARLVQHPDRPRYSSGLMILGGGRWGNERRAVGWWSAVQALRIIVIRLITTAPPTAGQNPVTENPSTR